MTPPEHCVALRSTTNKRSAHLLKGSKVEATRKAEGFVGSWFEATVIKPPEMPNSKFRIKRMTVIEYSDLLNEDASLLLRENVDCAMLRPVTPEHCMALRSTTDKQYAHLLKGSKVEATSKAEGFVGSWFEATVIKPPEMPNSKFRSKRMTVIEYSGLLNEDASLFLRENVDCAMIRPVPPKTEEDGGFEVGDVVDSFERDGWWTGKVDRVFKGEGGEVRYVVSFAEPKHEIEFGKDSLRLHLDWINGKWCRFCNGKFQELAVKENGCVTLAIDGIRNNPKEHLILNPAPTGCVLEGCSEMMPSMNEPSAPLIGKPSPPLPLSCHRDTIDLELPAKKLKRTCVEEPFVRANNKPAESSNPLRDYQNKECGYHIATTSHGKYNTSVQAKRSRTRAGHYKSIPDASITDDVSKADDVQKDLSLEEQLADAVQPESALAKQDEAPEADIVNNLPMQELALVAVGTELNPTEQGIDEAPEADAINNPHMQELTLVAVGAELNPKEQGHSKLVNDEKMTPVSEGTMGVLNEGQQPATNDVSVIRPSLPFLSVWEAVESLEIFRKFPQQPHFLPLMDARERFREGLAIAKMVTFAGTAEAAFNLSIDDSVNSFTDCLEALQTLEPYGFDAKTLQSRLVKLISLKETQQKIDEERNELKGQVSELKREIVGVEEEICEAVNKIKFYQDKLKSELVKKEKKGPEIFALETSLGVLNTVICHALLDFKDSGKCLPLHLSLTD